MLMSISMRRNGSDTGRDTAVLLRGDAVQSLTMIFPADVGCGYAGRGALWKISDQKSGYIE